MTLLKNLYHGIGLTAAAVALSLTINSADAAFTLTGTTAELVARGINADFETPAQTRGDGETTSTNNIGAGWTANLISGVSNNYGVQDPNITFYAQTTGGPLPGPFEGQHLGFFNLNNWYSQAEIVSSPVGRIQANQTYTLNVAVGARNSTAQDLSLIHI